MIHIQAYFDEIAQLFADMDNAYAAVAGRLGFNCQGCEDNCCRSLFYHFTISEFLWLRTGLAMLSDPDRKRITLEAIKVRYLQAAVSNSQAGTTERRERPMCPLNQDGRCVLYGHRPMICRLHGIPHVLQNPSGRKKIGPGCDTFHSSDSIRDREPEHFDRTPWYSGLAGLESQLRTASGCRTRIRMTIAEMILEEPQGFEISV